MANFRKWYPALALAVLTIGSAASANAQPAFACTSGAGVPPIVRAEGVTELVGDLVLNCTGGTPTAVGAQVPRVNFEIFLNTNVTSRVLGSGFSEALLLVDEPTNTLGTNTVVYCTDPTGCAQTGTGGAPVAADTPNAFHGRVNTAAPSRIAWAGVPIDPPGTTGTRIIRITNVRANASQLGVSSTLIPTQIVMFVSATSTTSIPIGQTSHTVAFVQPGLTFSSRTTGSTATFLQCVSAPPSTSAFSNVLTFQEGFNSAFKRRNAGIGSTADVTAALVPQADFSSNPFTESGFYNPAAPSPFTTAGLADSGTLLRARFTNVPAGVTLTVTSNGVTTNSITGVVTPNTNAIGAPSAGLAIRLVTPLTITAGVGEAVWEVMNSNPFALESVQIGVNVSFTAGSTATPPALGTATVAGSFAPIATTSSAIPRFIETAVASTLFTVNACTTNILFPFLTNQAGFDSGIAIANTSKDPFGTAAQAGACTLNYYGTTAAGGAAPAAQTSTSIASGTTLTATLSSGGTNGIVATPGFQGYVIAQCSFQYAHGLAFISDVGANRISEAYLGLIMDKPTESRTPFTSESLGN